MGEVNQYTSLILKTVNATILNGQSKSNIIDVKGTSIKTIFLPAAFDGSTLTFEISEDGTNFFPYYNINNMPITIDVTAGRAYGLAAIDLYSIQFLKIVSSATESAERIIKLIARAI
jgi:hypothetical protein